jgi:hypothetical protein
MSSSETHRAYKEESFGFCLRNRNGGFLAATPACMNISRPQPLILSPLRISPQPLNPSTWRWSDGPSSRTDKTSFQGSSIEKDRSSSQFRSPSRDGLNTRVDIEHLRTMPTPLHVRDVGKLSDVPLSITMPWKRSTLVGTAWKPSSVQPHHAGKKSPRNYSVMVCTIARFNVLHPSIDGKSQAWVKLFLPRIATAVRRQRDSTPCRHLNLQVAHPTDPRLHQQRLSVTDKDVLSLTSLICLAQLDS